MALSEHVVRFRLLVRNRAGQFAGSFDAVLQDAGIEVGKLPPQCPRANCFAERLVLTVRTELTDRMLIFREQHLGERAGRERRALQRLAAASTLWRSCCWYAPDCCCGAGRDHHRGTARRDNADDSVAAWAVPGDARPHLDNG